MTLQEAAIQMANQLRIQKEVIFGFVNERGRLPSNLGELEAWGNTPDRIYGQRRRQPNGSWTPIMPGPTPGQNPDDPGFHHVITNAEDSQLQPWYVNAPFLPGAMGGFGQMSAQTGGGGGTGRYSTVNGPKTLQEMEQELRNNGWPGPYGDQTAIVEAYARTTKGPVSGANGAQSDGSPGSGAGLQPLLDAVGYANTRQDDRDQALNDARVQDIKDRLALAKDENERARLQQELNQATVADARYDTQRSGDLNRWMDEQRQAQQGQQFEQGRYDARLKDATAADQFEEGRYDTRLSNERNLYSNLAQNLLNADVQLGSRPEDYFKYNQALSGGKDIFQQLFSGDAIPAYSAPTGEIKSGNIADLLQKMGMPGVPGGWTTGGGGRGVPGMGNPGGALNPGSEAAWMQSRGGRLDPGSESEWMQNRPSVFQYRPQPDIPFMPPVSDPRQQARAGAGAVLSGYQDYIKRLGVPYLQQDDQRLLDYYKTHTGLDDAGARYVAQKAADYYKTNQTPIPENILAGHITEALGQGRSPNPGSQGARQVEGAYGTAVRNSGRPYLPAGDPRSVDAFGSAGGMTPGQARWGSGQAGEFAGSSGYPATGGNLADIIDRARRRGYTDDPQQGQIGPGRRQTQRSAMAF